MVALYKAGLLDEEEIAELMPFWREHYERGLDPDLFYALGPGRFLRGAEASKALYKWACIPPDIVKKWDRERASRAKTIKKLVGGSAR